LTTSLGDAALLGTAGRILAVVFEWLYLVTLVSCFVLSLGNRPQGSNKLYMTMVYFWVFIMAYLMFAAVFITVTSIRTQLETHTQFTVHLLFENSLFTHLCVSMASTYALYLIMSILFFDPWHMFTSFIQYILLTPTYVNILNVYAFCNTHDITWGTKGDDKPAKLPTATVKPSGGIDVAIPTDDADLNTQYEQELLSFSSKWNPPPKVPTPSDKQEDYYKGFRSTVVLAWMFCNLALVAAVLNTNGFENLYITHPTETGVVNSAGDDQTTTNRSGIYLAVVLWSVAGLAAVRFLGSTWFLVLRFFRGV
jgi:chitin synthase